MTAAFTLLARDGAARCGRLDTAHGPMDTPAFMPVGTAGAVKAMTADAVRATGAQMILGNTYHLMLRPGAERVAALGGLHAFMDWPGPILTDSGGFQVMSLSGLREVSEEGVVFRSHIDGAREMLTPERSMAIQHALDADITMIFDECPAYPAERDAIAASMALSLRWAERSRAAFRPRPGYGLFGIVQGGVHADLRAQSAEALIAIGFEGYAIGGLAVGEGQALMLATLDGVTPHLPADKARYLMGVGKPDDIIRAVARGVDMFDCVLPTRSGRNAQAWTVGGPVNLRNARHRDDPRPLEAGCPCPACTKHSRAYLHHLIRADEMLGAMLLTWHNLTHYQRLMADLRAAIAAGRFADFAAQRAEDAARGDIAPWS